MNIIRREGGPTDLVLDGPRPGDCAPLAGPGQPEQLGRTEGEAGEVRLRTQSGDQGLVGDVRLLDTAIVRDVLSLSVDAVEVEGLLAELDGVVPVLVNDTLSSLQILLLGLRLPPVHQVP